MKAIKKSTYTMDKCYAIAEVFYNGEPHFVVAAEKTDACIVFDLDGNYEETVWDGPSGTMSIVPLDCQTGAFLATKKMYSPNDSQEAEIVLALRNNVGKWNTDALVKVPFAHRFDVLKSSDAEYLVISKMKSGHDFKDDWSHPGEFLVAEFPSDYAHFPQIEMRSILGGLAKNHGYTRLSDENGTYCVISAETGVYEIHPPAKKDEEWKIKHLIDQPTSDIAFGDLDGDGIDEMLTYSPFHGDTVRVFMKCPGGGYELYYEHPDKLDFVHSIWSFKLQGKSHFIIGHRKGESRDLYVMSYDNRRGYYMELIDKDCGSTNAYVRGSLLVSANREINEIAFYDLIS